MLADSCLSSQRKELHRPGERNTEKIVSEYIYIYVYIRLQEPFVASV